MKSTMLKTTGLAIALFVAGNTFAQDAGKQAPVKEVKHEKMTIEERADMSVKKLTAELTLTNEQQPKVREIILASLKQKAADESVKGDDATHKAQNEKRIKAKRTALKGVLTDVQYKKLEERWKAEDSKNKAGMVD